METLDSDSLTKSAKKKKELDVQAVKQNRKISDFFKTPEKQVDKQKQKSLLQFFAKSIHNDEKSEDESITSVDEVTANGGEITTPTNSDKENNEILEENEVASIGDESKSKLKKQQKEKGSERSKNELKKDNRSKPSDTSSEIKKVKKQKKKTKSVEDKIDDNMSDSVILLSDSSLDQSVTDKSDKFTENEVNKCEVLGLKSAIESKTYDVRDKNLPIKYGKEQLADKTKTDEKMEYVKEHKIDSDETKNVCSNAEQKDFKDKSILKMKESCSTKTKVNNEVSQAPNTIKHASANSLVNLNCRDKNVDKKKIKKNSHLSELKCLKSGSMKGVEKKIEDEKKTIDTAKITQAENQKVGNLISEKGKSKKSALKGKDMLNLLKEIQSAESDEAKKRKRKSKHKHHKIKETQKKDVLEIAVSEDNSDEKEETKETQKYCEEIGDRLKEISGPEGTSHSESTEDKNYKIFEKEICQGDGNRRSRRYRVENEEKNAVNNKQIRKGLNKDNVKVKKDKQTKEKQADKESVNVYLPGSANQLSYEDFTETLDGNTSQISEKKKENNTKEMSYSEYLQLIEKENDSVDLFDFDNENVNAANEDDGVKKLIKSATSGEDNLIPEKSNIKKFFSVMTSTPDREKVTKKEKKVPSRKARTVKKSDTDKMKSESSQDSECEIIETEIDVGVRVDIETVDSKNEVESSAENPKLDTPSKNALEGKKTQATLSFGKTGLTVLKPVSKSDEEELKNLYQVKNSVKSDKCDNPNQDKTEEKGAATPGRGRKSRKDTVDLNSTDSSVFATPENVRKRRVKRKLEEDDSESAESEERRKSLRKRYKVEAFQMDSDKKTPIKIKLKRCPKSSSSGEDSERSSLNTQKVKVNVKQSTAQALLEKAKRGRLKKHKVKNNKVKSNLIKSPKKKEKSRNESNSSEDSVTRRSSRLEGKIMASMEEVSLENIVISSSEDEGETEKTVRKRGRPKGSKNKALLPNKDVVRSTDSLKETPNKEIGKTKTGTPSKNRTPSKKTGMKLAPMFMAGKKKLAEPSPKKVVVDPEILKQRQAFLMSGVPEELRKQTASRIVSLADADYPPIPRTSHVLQAPADQMSHESDMLNIWDLRPVKLSLHHFVMPVTINPIEKFTGDLMCRNESRSKKVDNLKNFKNHIPIPDDVVELCLKEIVSFNSTYPVTAMYKALKEMKIETETPPPTSESMLKTDMRGILDGCTDMMVIDDEEDNGKKKEKKSLKLQKKTEQTVEESRQEEKPKPTGSSLQWAEKYCPAKTADVLGNSGVLKKLKTWLTAWKHVLDREARKARKLLMKKNKGKQLPSKKVDDDLWDDDSDFDLDSDDSDEDDSLCNTMLLTGPHGCGKTSSVYALALELGFKVHEVNASSCRSGKQVLSQLQEATQSHQVSSQGNHTPRKNTGLCEKPKAENKMPTAFTNLFKKAAPVTQDKQEGKQAGKKRKRNVSEKDGSPQNKLKTREKRNAEMKHKTLQLMMEDSSSQSVTRSLNLSSTTLILFDEVDIVFEDDRGFLSAIQNFMSNTKIPIILTTADPGFTHTFEGRYEQMNFKRPSVASITTHLQIVSLVENVRTDAVAIAELVQFHHSDIRKCLVALEFLLESGGGHNSVHKIIQTTKHSQNTVDALGLENENSQSCMPGDSCRTLNTENKQIVEEKGEASRDVDNSDDDFVAIKPLKKRRRVLEDDNSNSVDTCLQVTIHKPAEVFTVQDNAEATNNPAVHFVGLESLMFSNEPSIADSLTQGLQVRSEACLQDMICTCYCVKRTSDTDLLYNNLHILLPFNTIVVDSILTVSKGCSNVKTKTRKRIKTQSDLYDSEASNDASDVGKTEDTQEEDGGGESVLTESDSLVKGNSSENICLAKSLSCFTKFYDTMSSLDVLGTTDRMKVCDKMQNLVGRGVKGMLVAGVENELAGFRTHCDLDLDTFRMYNSEVETRSMCKLYNETSNVKEEVEKLCTENETFAEDFVLPVRRQSEHFSLVDHSRISVAADYKRACDNTVDNLPLVTQSNLRTVHLDYLPTLREICKTEQCRQVTNTKRRFHHYLDNITLPLKDRTIATLATTFV